MCFFVFGFNLKAGRAFVYFSVFFNLFRWNGDKENSDQSEKFVCLNLGQSGGGAQLKSWQKDGAVK